MRIHTGIRAFALVAVMANPCTAWAGTSLVCEMPWWTTEWNMVALGPIAQSFASPGSSVRRIDLLVAEGPSMSSGVQLVVHLRAGDLGGPVLGTSRPVELADGFNEVQSFEFEPPVPTVAGASYTLEIARVGDSGYAMVRGADGDPCPATFAWLEGIAQPVVDLWYVVEAGDGVRDTAADWGALKARYGSPGRRD